MAKITVGSKGKADPAHFARLSHLIGQVFTPRTPINDSDLFAGRIVQLSTMHRAVSQSGCHAILFGERGVGKTSLANVMRTSLLGLDDTAIATKVNCAADDTFGSIWRKILDEIHVASERPGIGFQAQNERTSIPLSSYLPNDPSPHDVRKLLDQLSGHRSILLAFDEFDRIKDENIRLLMADTIKSLSDGATGATILLVGVADSVDQLIKDHQSIERAIIQIPMPRMSTAEIGEIMIKGFDRLGCTIKKDAVDEIVRLSQGLPHIAHLLALHAGMRAFAQSSEVIVRSHVAAGTRIALEEWQQSVRTAYSQATGSNQPGHIYKEVLLACALADKDEAGFFTASAVREPLRKITGKSYDIPNYAQHLKKFSEDGRGSILQRTGESRRIRYRFESPMMHAYVIIRGAVDGLLTAEVSGAYLK